MNTMAVCEFHGYYVEFLNTRVTAELNDPAHGRQCFGKVLGLVEQIAICRGLEQITPEEAEGLTSVIYGLYPQFAEGLKAKLGEKNP